MKAAHLVLNGPLLLLEGRLELIKILTSSRGQLGLHAGLEARLGLQKLKEWLVPEAGPGKGLGDRTSAMSSVRTSCHEA